MYKDNTSLYTCIGVHIYVTCLSIYKYVYTNMTLATLFSFHEYVEAGHAITTPN